MIWPSFETSDAARRRRGGISKAAIRMPQGPEAAFTARALNFDP
jgi:hypothetical protein